MKQNPNWAPAAIGKRLRLFMDIKALDAEKLAADTGCKLEDITPATNGSLPEEEVFFAISKKYGVDLNWLLTGEGRMFNREVPGVVSPHEGITGNLLDTKYKNAHKLAELFKWMRIPKVETIILHKFMEAKLIFKDQVAAFLKKQKAAGKRSKNDCVKGK